MSMLRDDELLLELAPRLGFGFLKESYHWEGDGFYANNPPGHRFSWQPFLDRGQAFNLIFEFQLSLDWEVRNGKSELFVLTPRGVTISVATYGIERALVLAAVHSSRNTQVALGD